MAVASDTAQTQSMEFWEEEHRAFRDSFRKFVETEITPYHEQWEKDGVVPRELWLKAGEQGYLCMDVPEEYGGLGIKDFRFNAIIGEESIRAGGSALSFTLHSDTVAPYISAYGSEEQKQKYLPKCVTGEIVTAIAMTEPGVGSDLANCRATATPTADGFLLNGQKTFITHGLLADLFIVVAKTSPDEKHRGISLLLVEKGAEGFEPAKKLNKIGLHGQDTSELFFKDVRVPRENILGEEGRGFYQLMGKLPQERMSITVKGLACAETALEHAIAYCKERHAFGKPIGTFQNSRFKLAEMKTECTIARTFVHDCIRELNAGTLTPEKAAMAKWWVTEMQKRTVDQCVQLHGGYGYMMEYPIARMFVDTRVQTIFGGTTEIMKEIVGRSMGF